MSQPTDKQAVENGRRNSVVAVACLSLSIGMVGLSYAAVPLYQIFCQVTGYGGTPQIATAPSNNVIDTTLTMRFDANVDGTLGGWKFKPETPTLDIRYGENKLAYYVSTNTTDKPMTGTASFNVTPEIAGVYFNKIECFCFTEQTLQPGETVRMPVSFYVDPEMLKDKDAAHISQLTLSYTFHELGKDADETNASSAPEKRADVQIDEPVSIQGGKNDS